MFTGKSFRDVTPFPALKVLNFIQKTKETIIDFFKKNKLCFQILLKYFQVCGHGEPIKFELLVSKCNASAIQKIL